SPLATCTLSLHDALPICEAFDAVRGRLHFFPAEQRVERQAAEHRQFVGGIEAADVERRIRFRVAEFLGGFQGFGERHAFSEPVEDRKSTRLNSSHVSISY